MHKICLDSKAMEFLTLPKCSDLSCHLSLGCFSFNEQNNVFYFNLLSSMFYIQAYLSFRFLLSDSWDTGSMILRNKKICQIERLYLTLSLFVWPKFDPGTTWGLNFTTEWSEKYLALKAFLPQHQTLGAHIEPKPWWLRITGSLHFLLVGHPSKQTTWPINCGSVPVLVTLIRLAIEH